MIRLTEDDFAELVNEAVESLPDEFRPYMENVVVEVRPRPTKRQLASLKLAPGAMVLGLYRGVPLTRKTVTAPVDWPGCVAVFQRNIEAICNSRREIVERVRTTVLHEVGHHFGLSEEDLERLGCA